MRFLIRFIKLEEVKRTRIYCIYIYLKKKGTIRKRNKRKLIHIQEIYELNIYVLFSIRKDFI